MDSKTLLIVVAVILLFVYLNPSTTCSSCGSKYAAPKKVRQKRMMRKYAEPEEAEDTSMYKRRKYESSDPMSMYGLPTNNAAPVTSMYEGSFQAKNPAPFNPQAKMAAPVKSMYGLPTNNAAPVKSMYGLPTNNAAPVKSMYEGSFQAKNPAPVSFYNSSSPAMKMAAYKKKY